MKALKHTSKYALIFLGSFVLFSSCKKEVAPIAAPEQAYSAIAVNNSCKPVILGATIQYPGGPIRWATVMQKWYGSNGKLAFLKANFFTDWNDLGFLEHTVPWGELLYYNNNQVYLRSDRDTVMRVTLDAQQRPAASYYHHDHFPKGTFLIDTSYYHFTGNRLDSIINFRVESYGGHSTFVKFIFLYDVYGNLIRVNRWDPRFNFNSMCLNYDYTQAVTDMVPMQQVSIPYKLMEYMELLSFPVHHRLTQVTGFGNNWQYINYSLLGNGLVSVYHADGLHQRKFYTGWECFGGAITADAAIRQKDDVNSLADFKKLYPQ